MNDKRFLLIQIRQDKSVRLEEQESFAKYLNTRKECIDILNVFDTPNFSNDVINQYDAVLVGGASEASVSDDKSYPFVNECQRLLLHCIEVNKPVFASCFGFQLAVLALGGKITKNTQDFEMGTPEISVDKNALTDPIFKNIITSENDKFNAVSVHQESALTLPDCCQLLAYTSSCTHAFKVKNKKFWAFQFHPELDKKTLTERLGIYKDKYTEDSSHYQKIIDELVDTPKSNLLLDSFSKIL